MASRNTIFLIKILAVVFLFCEQGYADAKVDGFFRESLIKGGFFEGNAEINKPAETQNQTDSFFISREERRLNPDKAPSNSIKLPQHSVRIRTRSLGFPGMWGSPIYTEGAVISQ